MTIDVSGWARSLTLPVALLLAGATILASPAHANDNKRFNADVYGDIFTVQRQAGCLTDPKRIGQLDDAARSHAFDMLNNRALDGDVGSDGSTPQDRAAAAGFHGNVTETIAINPALAMSGIELINQWYYNPDYLAIMQNCANVAIGVDSENSLDRTVVVALYGQPR